MSPQQTIAHYRITSKLGEGGMGAVYRATDTKLNREVAIKILPDALANDPDYLARFTREAQVLASMNHPNIAAIYGVEDRALILELVPGATLEERIAAGPVPLEEALQLAIQIADALEAAHEKGIIHRDLKPANVKVTPEGVVKVLDFGLAKATGEAAPSSANSPTLTIRATQAGIIMGTAGYMAPEQAAGKPVDRRADIWSFGVVLYELLTGRRLFTGETVSHTLASVLKDPIDLEAPQAPAPIRRLLARCLDRRPKDRLRDIGEARIAIRDFLAEPAPAAQPVPTPARRSWLPWALVAVALAGAGAAWLRPKAAPPPQAAMRFAIPYPPGTTASRAAAATQFAVSPDGRYLAFIALDETTQVESLWIRSMASNAAHRVELAENAGIPFWSPDSQSIGFFSEDKLRRVPVSGGPVRTICDVPRMGAGATGDGATWNQDGVIVFATYGASDDVGRPQPLMQVAAGGGTPSPATTLGKDERWHAWPQFLPDGKHLLYFATGVELRTGAAYIQELGSERRVPVLKNATRAVWAEPGYLLYGRDSTIFAQRINTRTFQLEGEPQPIAQDVPVNEVNGRSAFMVSNTGILAFRTVSRAATRQLTWRGRDGTLLGNVGKPVDLGALSLSPDEKTIAITAGQLGNRDLWVMDAATGVTSRVTRTGKASGFSTAVWSPDSRRLVLTQLDGIYEVTLASGQIQRLTTAAVQTEAWMPDGGAILWLSSSGSRLGLLPVSPGAVPQTILDTTYRKGTLSVSPDGKWIAYYSYESGGQDIYVASFPSFAVKRKISTGGGLNPAWNPNGRELFYRSMNGDVLTVDIRVSGPTIDVGIPKVLFRFGNSTPYSLSRFGVSADGKRFLLGESAKQEPTVPEISVLLNWWADLK
jgi:eukaryotic-like serine/threonine-protein kinase